MSLLDSKPIYKPFHYPWAYDAWLTQQRIHWLPEEVPLTVIGVGSNLLVRDGGIPGVVLRLSAKGWRVGVFEQAAVAGGAVKTGEYTLPGFRHDWAAMNLSLFAGSAFFKAYGAELGQHGCAFVPVNRPFASSFPDGSWVGVSTDMAETTAAIRALSPRDAATWETLVSRFGAEAPHLFGLLGAPMNFRALAYFMFKTLRAKGVGGTLDMGRFLISSPRAWLEETFEHPQVRALLGAWGMHLDFAPDVAGGAMFPYLEGMAGQAFGMVIGQAILVLVGSLVGFVFSRSLTRPISELVTSMGQLADGNTNIDLKGIDRSDEIGDMVRSVAVFRQAEIDKRQLEAENESRRSATESERHQREAERAAAQAELVSAPRLGPQALLGPADRVDYLGLHQEKARRRHA